MDQQTARHVCDLEGRVAALSGIVSLLMWTLRERGLLSAELEREIYRSASAAAGTLPPPLEAGADRMILALSNARPMNCAAPSARG